MPSPDRPANSLETLTDKELEVLRLLTAGHTVKSIAVRLGRSETSINERLRDARRKTGVGSSRELARCLDAQKIWDKKIDLPAQSEATDEGLQLPKPERPTSKGKIIMLISGFAAAAGIAMATADTPHPASPPQSVQTAAPDRLPLAGSWSLDVARIPAAERPRRVTMTFGVSDNRQWTIQAEIIGSDGSRQHAESSAAADGVPVPMTGNMQFADRVALRQPAPNTLVMTFTKDGAPVSTRIYTVEADGRSMKETIAWAGETTPRIVTTYFNRLD